MENQFPRFSSVLASAFVAVIQWTIYFGLLYCFQQKSYTVWDMVPVACASITPIFWIVGRLHQEDRVRTGAMVLWLLCSMLLLVTMNTRMIVAAVTSILFGG